jgi:arsenic resistance protein ArsH
MLIPRYLTAVCFQPRPSTIASPSHATFQPGRLKAGSYRDRVVDVAEEMYKITMLMRDHTPLLVDR